MSVLEHRSHLGLIDSCGGVWVVIVTLTGGKPDALQRMDTIAQRLNVTLNMDVGESPICNYMRLTTKFIFHIKTKYILA